MNILFVVDGLNEGGAGRVVARLSSYFVEEGINTFVLPVFDRIITYDIDPRVEICSTFNEPLKHSVFDRIILIRKNASKVQADVVISFLSYINLYSIVAGIGKKWKTIVSERNNPYTDPSNKRIRFIRRYLYLIANGIVFQTEDARNYFSKIIRRKSRVIPNPVARDIIPPYKGERNKTIVSVGRLTKQKNYSMALIAMNAVLNKHPDYVYEIYGQGEELDNIVQLIDQLNIKDKVVLKGHVVGLIDYIKDASVFVLSSDYEGMSNSLIEAMAVGLPVVSTDHPIGGARMLINNEENGILVPVGDDRALSEAVCYLIENPQKAESISKEATMVREKYSISKIGNKWLEYTSRISGIKK